MSELPPGKPAKYEPSHGWTQEDRLNVALDILNEMRDRSQVAGGASSAELGDWANRVAFVLNKPPRFLEDNREVILHGQPSLRPSR